MMKDIRLILVFLTVIMSVSTYAQEKKKLKGAELEANQYVFEGNKILTGEEPDVLAAEKNYRRAIAKDANRSNARYNLGVSHFATKNHQEAADRFKQAAKLAKEEGEKSAAFYNEGNAYMELQKFKEAIEAYKDALRNNPYDNDARKNLAIAKKMKEEQDKQNKDQDKEQNKDDNKKEEDSEDSENKKDGEGDDTKEDENSENESEEDKDNKEEDEKEGDKKDDADKKEDPKEGEDKDENDGEQSEEQQQPQEGKLSPDQVKSLLDAMADEEKKVQEKMNAQKVKGARVKSDKDW